MRLLLNVLWFVLGGWIPEGCESWRARSWR